MQRQQSSEEVPLSVRSVLTDLATKYGTITPQLVLEHAKSPQSPLHSHFEWDNDEAAESYRLLQASNLIRRVKVTILPHDGGEPQLVRAFVSLQDDRDGTVGYRPMQAVLASAELRAELLRTAKSELKAFRNKYRQLKELSDVFASMEDLLKD